MSFCNTYIKEGNSMNLRKITAVVLAFVTVLSLSCVFTASAEDGVLLERTAFEKGTGLYANWYNASVEKKQETDGTTYVHATPNFANPTKQLNFDATGLSAAYTDGVYFKAVVRTNVTGTPLIKVGSKDSATGTNYGVASAANSNAESALSGSGEWEEILIPVSVKGGDTITQIWSYITGGIVNISNYAEDAYIDVAAWGLFTDRDTAANYEFYTGKETVLNTVYVSETGDDTADGESAETAIASVDKAYSMVADGGTIIVSGAVTLPKVTISSGRIYGIIGAEGKSVTIKGSGTEDKITSGRVTVYGNATLEDITLEYTDSTGEGILLLGNSLTVGKNVEITHPATADGNNNLIQNHDSVSKPAPTQGGFDSTVTLRSGSLGSMSLGAMYGTTSYFIEGRVTYNIGGADGDTPNVNVISQNVYSRSASAPALFNGDARVNVKAGTVGTLAVGNANGAGSYKGLRYYTVDGGEVGKILTTGNANADSEMTGVTVIEINGGKVGSVEKRGDDASERIIIVGNGVTTTVNDSGATVVTVTGEGSVKADITAPTLENSWTAAYNGLSFTTGKKYVFIDGVKHEAKDITASLYTDFTVGTHTVRFTDTDNVTVTIDGISAEYAPGDTITLPDAPDHENAEHYVFKWTDGENDYDAGATYTVTGAAAITAKWTAKTYTIKVNGVDETHAYGEKITLGADPDPKEGYDFDWYDKTNDVHYAAGAEYEVKGNAELVATWTAKTYTITVNGVEETHAYGEKITLGEDPDPKTDYTFKWYDKTNGAYYAAGAEYEVKGGAEIVPEWKFSGAAYIPEGSYNAAEGKYIVNIYFENAKVNGGVFGFKYNPAVMTFESCVSDFVLVGEELNDAFTDDRTNGIYVDRWVSSVTPGVNTEVDATAGKVRIATLTFAMADHTAFNPETDFTAAVVAEDPQIYKNGKFLAQLSEGELEVKYIEVTTLPLTEIASETYKVIGTVVTSRDDGDKPYDSAEYSSRARITLMTKSGNAIATLYEAADADTAIFAFEFDGVLPGTYDIKIEKNGYKTYIIEDVKVIDSNVDVLNAPLTAGDIKGSFADYCGDGKIDVDDFIRVLRGFDKSTSETFRQVVDIDEDGDITISDIGFIKLNYGR